MQWVVRRLLLKKLLKINAGYVLAVKNNQEQLFENIEDEFRFSKEKENFEDIDLGQGRIETRKCCVLSRFQHIENQNIWKNLQPILRIESTRGFKNNDKPKKSS